MDFFEAVKKRRSVRVFQEKNVEEEKLEKILEAANSAPSAGDLQAYEIIIVRDEKRKQLLASAALGQDFIAEAPVALVVLADPPRSAWKYGKRGSELYSIQDATIAGAYIQLAAVALGLSTTWVGALDDEEVKKIVGAPVEAKPVAIIPLGYAGEAPAPTPRRRLSDLAREEKF